MGVGYHLYSSDRGGRGIMDIKEHHHPTSSKGKGKTGQSDLHKPYASHEHMGPMVHDEAPEEHAGHGMHTGHGASHEGEHGPGQMPGMGSMEHDHTHAHPTSAAESGMHEGHAAHTDHTGHEQMFRQRFWISLLLSIPVLLLSQGLQTLLGYSLPEFFGSRWIAPLFAVIVFFYGGLPFIKMAIPELKNRLPGMMTLISLAISVAFVYSLATLFLPG